MRPLASYHKVQRIIGSLIRGRGFGINKRRIKGLHRLNIGCGRWPDPRFINLDWHWMPGVDVCWDLTHGPLPFATNSLAGVYSEHCLDCIPRVHFERQMREVLRCLKPGGTFRVVLPDGEMYLDLYHQRKTDKNVRIPYASDEATAMMSVNRYAREHTHQYSYDFETLALLLRQAGYSEVALRTFMEGRDPELLIDRPERQVESFYVEAVK